MYLKINSLLSSILFFKPNSRNNNLGRLEVLEVIEPQKSETHLIQVEMDRDWAFQLTRFLPSGTGSKKTILRVEIVNEKEYIFYLNWAVLITIVSVVCSAVLIERVMHDYTWTYVIWNFGQCITCTVIILNPPHPQFYSFTANFLSILSFVFTHFSDCTSY